MVIRERERNGSHSLLSAQATQSVRVPPIFFSPDFNGIPALPLQFHGTRFTKATRRPCAATTRKATHHPERTTERLASRFAAESPRTSHHVKQEPFIMAKFYCKYCGLSFSSVQSLTSTTCSRHPDGVGKGRHALYEGDEAPEYTCKYCGKRASTIASLTSQTCPRHPDGNGKGRHSPAL